MAGRVVSATGSAAHVDLVVALLDSFGYNEMGTAANSEASTNVVRDLVVASRQRPTKPGASKPYPTKTHGVAEGAV